MYLEQAAAATASPRPALNAVNPFTATPKPAVTFSTDPGTWGPTYAGRLTRATGSWIADGFMVGQTITISGITGTWRIASLNPTQMMLVDGPALRRARGRLAA